MSSKKNRDVNRIIVIVFLLIAQTLLLFEIIKVYAGDSSIEGQHDAMLSYLAYAFIVSFIVRIVLLIFLFKYVYRYQPLLTPFILLEIAFSIAPISMGSPTYQMLNWQFYFSRPMNELHYRDSCLKHRESDKNGKRVLIIGDSFTEGNGIKFIRNRYDKVLQAKLTDHFHDDNISVNIAANAGWGTRDEFNALTKYPVYPDILVLQYYINDVTDFIDETNPEFKNLFFDEYVSSLPLLAKLSYTTNFIYGVFIGKWFDLSKINQKYLKTINAEVTAASIKEIENLILYCNKKGIQSTILIIPDLTSLYIDTNVLSEITRLAETYHVSIIYPIEALKQIPLKDRVVNRFDEHASIEADEVFAEEIYKTVLADKLLK